MIEGNCGKIVENELARGTVDCKTIGRWLSLLTPTLRLLKAQRVYRGDTAERLCRSGKGSEAMRPTEQPSLLRNSGCWK